MYFLKTKGTDKVTDFVEIRDDSFSLIEFIKLSDIHKKIPDLIKKYNLQTAAEKIVQLIEATPFGKIEKIE